MLFANLNDADYEYSLGGTAFVGFYNGHYYAITAKHCLNDRKPEEVRIELSAESSAFLPFERMITINNAIMPNGDCCDLAFFEIAHSKLREEELEILRLLDLSYLINYDLHLKSKVSMLALKGYPYELGNIDYDGKTIARKGYLLDGIYAGPSEDMFCSKIHFPPEVVQDHNGLSGSPVFFFERTSAVFDYHFAGIYIRANHDGTIGQFIDSNVVFRCLRQLHP